MPHTLFDEPPVYSEQRPREGVGGRSKPPPLADPLMATPVSLKGQVIYPFDGCFCIVSSYLGSGEIKAAMGGLS